MKNTTIKKFLSLLKVSPIFKVFALLLLLCLVAWAQDPTGDQPNNNENPDNGETETTSVDLDKLIGKDPNAPLCDYGTCILETNTIDNFEQSGHWYGHMYSDHGLIGVQRRRGYASHKDGFSLRELRPNTSFFVLGMKVNFRRLYYSQAKLIPPRPVHLYGKVKKLNVWAFGNSVPHKLYAVIKDARGQIYRAPFTSGALKDLNFEAWNKLEAIIPYDYKFSRRKDEYKRRVVQKSQHNSTYYNPEGIEFLRFEVDFDAVDAIGVYYLYLDEFTYVSDTYEYNNLNRFHNLPAKEITYPLDNW